MERVTNVLVLEKKGLGFEQVKRQVLAWQSRSLMVHATGLKQLEYRLNWAAFDFVLVNFGMPNCGALSVLLLVRERFPSLPIVFIIEKRGKYSESDIQIIKNADGCVYQEEIFGKVGIIEDLMGASLGGRRLRHPVRSLDGAMTGAVSSLNRNAVFKGCANHPYAPATSGGVSRYPPGSDDEITDPEKGHRSRAKEVFGDDPHSFLGADAGAGN